MRATPFALALAAALATTALAAPPATAQDFDHSALDGVLQAHVKGDKVDYAGLAQSAELKAYVGRLAEAKPDALPGKAAKLAFWINAYNALTITGVLRHWPAIDSVSTIKPDYGFFKGKDFVVGGQTVSLNDIENEIIRPRFKDPRVHAALNCASVSCPPLLNRAFVASRLEAQLDQVFGAWVNDDARNRLDAEGLKLSKIFDWYKTDFEPAGGVKAWLKKYAKGEKQAAVDAAPTVGFLDYDWRLNKR